MLRNLSCGNLNNYYCKNYNNHYDMEDDIDMENNIDMDDNMPDCVLEAINGVINGNVLDELGDNIFDSYNINLKYYDLGDNYSIYNNKSNNDFEYPSLDLNFNDLFNKYNVKKENKTDSFKKLINSKVNINSNFISCKCNRNTKNLNKLITMFSGPSNKDVLNEIVSSNLHKI